ncbi:MAG: kinase/pyrophosphorylase [Acidobacteria bacterium]|nr:MAG: kinase/pyrophosphorylase [Acidobacteriota bacterium]
MRTMFYVSDRTAITSETIGHSLLAQFETAPDYREVTIPYVDTPEKGAEVVTQVNAAAEADGEMPFVFSTLADPVTRNQIHESRGLILDLFEGFLGQLEQALGAKAVVKRTRSHRISNLSSYEARIAAIDYSLQHDDGARIKDYDKADIIMLGVSRVGKTPSCLYLAMHFGIRAANYPITEEDLSTSQLPVPVAPFRDRLHGLTIDPKRLASIREERRRGSRYASIEQCRSEVRQVEALFKSFNIPFINTTITSVEEISTRVVQTRGLDRHTTV